jgi:DUF1365 family protein
MAPMTDLPARSAVSLTHVRHRRYRPTVHRLNVSTFHLLVDVDELPRLDREVSGFAYNRRAVIAIHDRDHLSGSVSSDVGSLRSQIANLLAAEGFDLPSGPLQLLCHPRVFGHVFNPVAWWFAHHPDGQLGLVLAEVTSTFGDRVVYVLDDLERLPGGAVRAYASKRLHVSPFLPVSDHNYTFVIRPPGAPLRHRAVIHMDVLDAEGTVLDATQRIRLAPFTSQQLRRVLIRYPLVSLRSLTLIHFHALVLWCKRVPFHRRPAPPADAVRVGRKNQAAKKRGSI